MQNAQLLIRSQEHIFFLRSFYSLSAGPLKFLHSILRMTAGHKGIGWKGQAQGPG